MIITLAVRILQLIFAIVVLALSIVLINDFGPAVRGLSLGHVPSLIDYGAFCGGAGLLIAAIGVAAAFFEPLQGIIILALDGLAAFFLLAGGIAFAVKVPIGDCGSETFVLDQKHSIFWPSDNKNYGKSNVIEAAIDDAKYRCRMLGADTAFVWFLFAAFLVSTALSFTMKSGRRGGAMV